MALAKKIDESMGVELQVGMVFPIRLRLELSRNGYPDGCNMLIERYCHYYNLLGDGECIDLFAVEAGQLVRIATYNNVLSIEKIENSK